MRIYALVGAFLFAVALLAGTYRIGYKQADNAWKVRYAEAKAEVEKVKAEQAKVTERVVVEYRDRIVKVKEKGDAIEKLVPVYIHGGEFLSGGWRVLHDAAASGQVPESAERALATAAPVESATAARTVAENYAACRSDQEELLALQKWAIQQAGVSP